MEYFKVFPQKLSWKVCSNQMAAIFMDLKKIGDYRLEISHWLQIKQWLCQKLEARL